jgi:predicted nuclease of restriction endonuclease-like (RecB) superfamily
MSSEIKTPSALLKQIRELILSARKAAARTIDSLQVVTCFEIGRRIVVHEQQGADRAEYGKNLLRGLAIRLTGEFGPGFSKSNLEYMRRFYLMYQDRFPLIAQTVSGQLTTSEKSQTLSGQSEHDTKSEALSRNLPVAQKKQLSSVNFTLSWSQYVFLMGIKNPEERSFYEIEATTQGWAVRELKRQFNSGLYERLALSRDKDGIRKLARKGQIIAKPQDMLKEPIVLEFLGLDEKEKYSETDLESAIIDKLEHFLLELGKGFLFEARQKRFTFDADHFFVDLVFYNRLLRCYVLIDLKIGKLTHQDLGQMQMYVNYFDQHVKTPEERPTVGIILCKKKHDALVEITLPQDANIFASQYQLYLPTKEDLRQKLLDWTEEQEENLK